QQPDDHDGQPDAAPGRLEREHDAERRDHVVERLEAHDLYEVAGQVRVPDHDVQVDRESHQGQHRVPPGDPGLTAAPLDPLARRVEQEDDRGAAGEVDRTLDQGGPGAEDPGVEMEHGQG